LRVSGSTSVLFAISVNSWQSWTHIRIIRFSLICCSLFVLRFIWIVCEDPPRGCRLKTRPYGCKRPPERLLKIFHQVFHFPFMVTTKGYNWLLRSVRLWRYMANLTRCILISKRADTKQK
jgi:hypothetical protein